MDHFLTLAAAQSMDWGWMLSGIILSFVMGATAGNYACSLVHRLPRGRAILDKKPYCGSCGAMLQVRDLFPIISALMLRHRCRYCGAPFPTTHTWTEALIALLFVLCFLQYDFSEQYLLVAIIGSLSVTLAAIETNEGYLEQRLLAALAALGAVWRVLHDHTIFGAFEGAFLGLMLAAFLFMKHIRKVNHIYVLPPQAWLVVLGGLILGVAGGLKAGMLAIVLIALRAGWQRLTNKKIAAGWVFLFSVCTLLIFSGGAIQP